MDTYKEATAADLAPIIKNWAKEAGFDACAITDVRVPWAASDDLRAFVAGGLHGQMGWMAETLERRVHPQGMWPDAISAIVVGKNYGPTHSPLDQLEKTDQAAISVYAGGDDYHDVVKKGLKELAGNVHRHLNAEVKVFVDTAPLMEKPLAAAAGIGWAGKHTNIVSREFGSWLFLGVVLVAKQLAKDGPIDDHCGSCQACLDICPTKAFIAPRQIDARRCISYLTIEFDGVIEPQLRPLMGNRIYGCDDCLAICPWNKFAQSASDMRLTQRPETEGLSLSSLAMLDDEAFRALFRKSAVKRIGVNRFLRNVAVALGNMGQKAGPDEWAAIIHLINHDHNIVRAHAVWALSQMGGVNKAVIMANGLAHGAKIKQTEEEETDPLVLAEWANIGDHAH